jgi:hypothetical protein
LHLVRVDEVVELAAARLEDDDLGYDESGQEWAQDGPHHVHEPRRVQDDEQRQVAGVSARAQTHEQRAGRTQRAGRGAAELT